MAVDTLFKSFLFFVGIGLFLKGAGDIFQYPAFYRMANPSIGVGVFCLALCIALLLINRDSNRY